MKKQYTKQQIQEAINYWQKQLDMMDKIDESKIADYFGKLFKTKSWVQKQQKLQDELKKQQDELKKQQDELKYKEFIKKYPLKALVDEMQKTLNQNNISARFCLTEDNKQFIAYKFIKDGYDYRYDNDMKMYEKFIIDTAKKCGLKSSNYKYIVVDRLHAVLQIDDPTKVVINESENDFKKIDDIVTYLKDKKLKWIKVVKFQRLNAYQSKGGEEIETVGSDGNIETKRKTKSGDWVVNNVSNKDNKWIIDDKTFKKKYEEEKDGVYKPKGGSMLAAKVSDCEDVGVEFAPPNWGGDFIKIKNDGWFMKDPSNEKDIYAISKEDFDLTYKKA